MDIKTPTVENETLEINDTHRSTRGGPPIWLALSIVAGLFLVVAAGVFIVLWAT